MNMVDVIEKDTYVYECANCKARFRAVEIKLVGPADNFTISTPGYKIMCAEKNGDLRNKENPRQRDGDKLLACPKCGHIHLNGFNFGGFNREGEIK